MKYLIGESLRVVYDVVAYGRHFVMSARTFANSAAVFRLAEGSAERVLGMPSVAHEPEPTPCGGRCPTIVDRDVLDVATQYNRIAASIALLDGIRTPRALGWARPDRIVVLEPMRGRSWNQLPAEVQPGAMRHFGAVLANVHGLPTDFGRGPFQRYRPDRVRNSADLVAVARPDVAEAVGRLRDKLAEGPPASGAIVCLHGDAHAKNVMFHGDQVHMIDFDQGGSGAAGADIGSMLATLLTARLLDPDTAADGLGAALLSGYRDVRPLPSNAELQWYTAAAFVAERAIRAVNRVNHQMLAVLPELLETADSVFVGKLRVDG